MANAVNDLDLMFERAVTASSADPDVVATETISYIIINNPTLAHKTVLKIADRLHSRTVNEVFQTLNVLDYCMSKCGIVFQQEIGKFRFLNEIIKLVSPNHSAETTPKEIREKMMDLMLIWTFEYPKELKIKEAYEMLIKQGISHEAPKSHRIERNNSGDTTMSAISTSTTAATPSIRIPNDFDRIPKNLLLSKNPKDIQAANLLIEKMVEADKRKTDLKVKRKIELKKCLDICSLLNDMLNKYCPDETTGDEESIMNELYCSCKSLIASVSCCVQDVHNNELLDDALQANDNLLETINRYKHVVEDKKPDYSPAIKNALIKQSSSNLLESLIDAPPVTIPPIDTSLNIVDELKDIFSTELLNSSSSPAPHAPPLNIHPEIINLLQPVSVGTSTVIQNSSAKQISDELINKTVIKNEDFKNNTSTKQNIQKNITTIAANSNTRDTFNLDSMVKGLKSNLNKPLTSNNVVNKSVINNLDYLNNFGDDDLSTTENISSNISHLDEYLVNFDKKITPNESKETTEDNISSNGHSNNSRSDISTENSKKICDYRFSELKPLSELSIDLNSINPSEIPPKTIMDDTQGLKIVLHFASNRPRDDVSIIVITTTNQSSKSISDYVFDASISKPCKLRLLPVSGTTLVGIKPFRPPTEDITQVLLISNKDKLKFSLICIVSYCVEDDPDPIKESITLTDLPQF